MKLVLLAIILGLLACPWCEAQSEDKGCVIELNITGNFLPDRIEPDVANLGGKDMRDNYFAPGKYRLEIAQPGYFPISEDVTIPEGQKVLRIERVLRAKPRRIQWKITHDTPPPEHLPPYEINLAPENKRQDVRVAHDGDEVEPGTYFFHIKQMGYELLADSVYIWPSEEPMVLAKQLAAKPVVIQLNVEYDVDPPEDLPECQVALSNPKTNIPRYVTDGRPTKPGRYYLELQRPGYSFGPKKEISIAPSEEPYAIHEKLVAKLRPISFEIQIGSVLCNVHRAFNAATGKDITFQDTFRPGEEIECIVQIKRHKTMRAHIKIVPGEGPFVANVPVIRFCRYEFFLRQNKEELNHLTYPYILYADTELIEDHLIEYEGRTYTVWVAPEAKNLVVYAGYLFAKIGFDKVAVCGIPRLTDIHTPRLIEHLCHVARREERGDAAALDVLASLVSDPARYAKLKAASIADIRRLLEYVQGWKLAESQDQARCKAVIEALEGLVKEGR